MYSCPVMNGYSCLFEIKFGNGIHFYLTLKGYSYGSILLDKCQLTDAVWVVICGLTSSL